MDKYEPNELSKTDAYAAMANSRRRLVVELLLERPDQWELRPLAEAIVARGSQQSGEEISKSKEYRTLQALAHWHIPKLVEAGVVTYDDDDEIIIPNDTIGELEPLI